MRGQDRLVICGSGSLPTFSKLHRIFSFSFSSKKCTIFPKKISTIVGREFFPRVKSYCEHFFIFQHLILFSNRKISIYKFYITVVWLIVKKKVKRISNNSCSLEKNHLEDVLCLQSLPLVILVKFYFFPKEQKFQMPFNINN